MSTEPDDIKIVVSNFSTIEIKKSQGNSYHLKKDIKYSNQLQTIDSTTKELECRNKEREEQIELLTKSLTSSSRIVRWISSLKTVVKQFL
mgnify:CR=1 FL=1